MEHSEDYVISEDGVLRRYKGTDETMIIPAGVKVIGSLFLGYGGVYGGSNVKKIIVPEGVTEIKEYAFYYSKFREIILPKSLRKIEKNAFDSSPYSYPAHSIEMSIKCPSWPSSCEKKTSGLCYSLMGGDGSSISFKNDKGEKVAYVVLAHTEETNPKKYGAIYSIKSVEGRFDFDHYDSYFGKLTKTQNRIKVALARTMYPYQLSEENKNEYENYLKRHGKELGEFLARENNQEAIVSLSAKYLLNEKAISSGIETANSMGKTELVTLFLEAGNMLSSDSHKKHIREMSKKAKPEKNPYWNKPRKYSGLVGKYLGSEEHVVFPEVVEGVRITGIANSTGRLIPDNYRNIVSVELPEGYTYIGRNAFAGCEKLETIKLPSTMGEIRSRAFANCKSLKDIALHRDYFTTGEEIFYGAEIGTVVFEGTTQKIPPFLFAGCKINNFVIYDGEFKSAYPIFMDVRESDGFAMEHTYLKKHKKNQKKYEKAFVALLKKYVDFPKNVYVRGEFSPEDIKLPESYKYYKDRIHPLSEFDETQIIDEEIRKKIIRIKELQKGENG